MSILNKLEKISFKKLLSIIFVAGLALAAPIVVWTSQQETKLEGRAFFEKPEIIKPVQKYGSPSQGDPRIDLVWPFLGKVGDAVLIEGGNFGDNPQNKQLRVGNQVVPEEKINQWTNELIEFTIPPGSVSSLVNLQVAGKAVSWPYLFTVYQVETNLQVTEDNDIVRAINAPAGAKMEIIFSDKSKMESDQLNGTRVPSDKTIMTVIVKNQAGNPIPFYVEPDEFGF